MNDFTKEELCSLQDSRCYHMDDSYPSNDPLFKKLKFMIDNYCEHEKTCLSSACDYIEICHDCDKVLGCR